MKQTRREQVLAARADNPMTLELTTEKKKIQIQVTEDDHERLRDLANESNMTQGDVLRAALILLEFRALSEQLQFRVDPDKPVSSIELASILIARDSGLITQEEADLCLAYAYMQPEESVAHRLSVLFKRLDSQLKRASENYSAHIEEFRKFVALPTEEKKKLLSEGKSGTPVNYEELRRSQMETRSHGS